MSVSSRDFLVMDGYIDSGAIPGIGSCLEMSQITYLGRAESLRAPGWRLQLKTRKNSKINQNRPPWDALRGLPQTAAATRPISERLVVFVWTSRHGYWVSDKKKYQSWHRQEAGESIARVFGGVCEVLRHLRSEKRFYNTELSTVSFC